MKSILKLGLVVAALVGTSALTSGAATAGVSIGIAVPAVVIAPSPGYVAYDDQYYYDPIYIGGAWYHGPYRWRMRGGERVFFLNGRWHRNEWRQTHIPASIVFRNGGSFREGRYDGFEGAERINARFHVGGHDMREDRPELHNNKADQHEDGDNMRQERKNAHEEPKDGGHEGGTH